jgi:TRAP-type C4-dicarboxylate transport system permease small subunit
MGRIRTVLTIIDRARDAICVSLLAGIVILVGIQVVYRYVLNDPLSWPEEVARNAFVWLIALGTVKLFRERKNYVIDFFLISAPQVVQRAAAWAFDIAALLFFAALLIGDWPVLRANANIRTAIDLPMNVLYASFAVAALLAMPAILVSMYERLRGV